MKIIFFAIFAVLLFVPVSVFAQERPVAMSSQIIVRDSNQNLVAYLEVNKIEYVSLGALHKFLDSELNDSDQIISKNGQDLQVIRRSIDYTADSDNVISDTTLNANFDGKLVTLVRPIHDGIPVRAGDTITILWTFVRAA